MGQHDHRRLPGGDDPAYVTDMLGFFQANAASIAYEANFQGPPPAGSTEPAP